MDLVGDGVFATAETDRVAPGLDVTRFTRLEEEGWTAGSVLTADLKVDTLELDVVNSGTVTDPVPVSEHLARSGAVAGVNGDFFDINYSNAARGTAVGHDGLLNGTATPYPALAVSEGIATVGELSTVASVSVDGVDHDLAGVNTPHLPAGGIGVYTAGWGDHPLTRPVGGPDAIAQDLAAVRLSGDDTVTEVLGDLTGPQLEEIDLTDDDRLLLGRGGGAEVLEQVTADAEVTLDIAPSLPADAAVTGSDVLLADGVVVADDPAVHPRTAVGVGPDGSELFVLALDGRAHVGRGMSLPEVAQLLLDMGATDAVNLDGGGSTTMVARTAGAAAPQVMNTPSDGEERPVPNALVFRSTAESGTVADAMVDTVSEQPHTERVLPGLRRTLEGTALDANLAPVEAEGTFSTDSSAVSLSPDGSGRAAVTGTQRGTAEVSFTAGEESAATELEVIGELDHVRASRDILALAEAGDSGEITVTGADADGTRAPIEVTDIQVEAPDGFTVERSGIETLTVTAHSDDAAGTLRLSVAGHTAEVALSAGMRTEEVVDFSDAADWTFDSARASGEVAPATGPEPGTSGLDVSYDFTQSTATRGGYAVAPEPVELPGQPRAVTMWMRGSGDGEWLRLQVRTGDGTVTNLDGPMVTWEGWQQISFEVPPGTSYPLTLERVRMMETRPDAQYQGEVTLGPISAVVSAEVDPPQNEPVHDPVIVTDGTVDDRPLHIAVMSDAQFVARNPDSDLVQAARRTLQEIVAADPDLLVINGDLVDEATPADFDLARRVLTEEVGDAVPWVYVPGNHEIMGGEIENFIDEFGDPQQALTVQGTRIVTLDSSTGTLNGGGTDQLRMLEDQLASAAQDPAVTGVLVFAHHPTRDPLPDAASQLTDREEAAALERTLADFRRETGKSAASIAGHVGVFHGSSVDGVSYLVNGNSGKGPSGTPAEGGFTGWTMLGVDPAAGKVGRLPDVPGDRLGWLRAQVNPRVDEVTLTGPSRMRVGDQADVAATVVQDDGREVPVGWPVSADWDGHRVTIDDGGSGDGVSVMEARGGSLRYNPATGVLTAVHPGRGVLTVEVNGEVAELPVVVRGPAR